MKDELLKADPWVELRRVKDPERGIEGYVYSREVRCMGVIVTILPYRYVGPGQMEVMLRAEVTPCWDVLIPQISSITGGYETDRGDVADTALLELREEAGFEVEKPAMIPLGTCRGTKSTDTMYCLFAADLTSRERGAAEGDGSVLESQAYCFWTPQIDMAVDPLVYVLYYRLCRYLRVNPGKRWICDNPGKRGIFDNPASAGSSRGGQI